MEFFFNNLAVGYFTAEKYPTTAGRFEYMPYRGPGHYQMQEEIEAQGCCQCYYQHNGKIIQFVVLNYPKYGVLDLAEFNIVAHNAT